MTDSIAVVCLTVFACFVTWAVMEERRERFWKDREFDGLAKKLRSEMERVEDRERNHRYALAQTVAESNAAVRADVEAHAVLARGAKEAAEQAKTAAERIEANAVARGFAGR